MKVVAMSVMLALLIVSVNALAANITARVDRDPVAINESFSLTYRADGPSGIRFSH